MRTPACHSCCICETAHCVAVRRRAVFQLCSSNRTKVFHPTATRGTPAATDYSLRHFSASRHFSSCCALSWCTLPNRTSHHVGPVGAAEHGPHRTRRMPTSSSNSTSNSGSSSNSPTIRSNRSCQTSSSSSLPRNSSSVHGCRWQAQQRPQQRPRCLTRSPPGCYSGWGSSHHWSHHTKTHSSCNTSQPQPQPPSEQQRGSSREQQLASWQEQQWVWQAGGREAAT